MAAFHQAFEQVPIDRTSIPQETLDLELRGRTNLFPWRGQFSPCLVDVLLSEYSSRRDRVFDPFAGVGTTLFESARKQLASCGTEINPAAIAMADTVGFVPLDQRERSEQIQSVEALLIANFGYGLPLFNSGEGDIKVRLVSLINRTVCALDRSLLTNALIRVMKSNAEVGVSNLLDAFRQHSEVVMSLPFSSKECHILNADARQTGLESASVDLVITSPPYINVFNYHQNNRAAMELLGCDVLAVAKSEFGSNRKNRGNRFLTVVQYCLDLDRTFVELRRVIKNSGRAVFIVGRESNVRGVPFQNGSLVASLAEMAGFKLSLRQERKFRNMFGEIIYEDILHFLPDAKISLNGNAREVAIQSLEKSLNAECDTDVKKDIRNAILSAREVEGSPLFVAEQNASRMAIAS
jgi:hypothetical protein